MNSQCIVADSNVSDHRFDGKFVNPDVNSRYKLELSKVFSGLWMYFFEKSKDVKPKSPNDIPIIKHNLESLLSLDDYSIFRVTHSTLLMKIDETFWLTDPVFSDNISPYSWFSNNRFHNLPITIEELPEIEGVIISHNHYDHLDEESIKRLHNKTKKFFVPLGLANTLIKFGVDKEKIVELDWWESVKHGPFELTAAPAQHFSGRGLFDGGETLWCSWILKTPKAKLYFSGDSGYFDGFKEIGEKYGPFDMTFMEAGAYNEDWKEMHMMPNQSVQAHIDLKGKIMFPIHNSSFEMAMHSWYEPMEIVQSEASKKNVNVTIPKMGENIPLLHYIEIEKWWKKKIEN